jgi:hypothetical protein
MGSTGANFGQQGLNPTSAQLGRKMVQLAPKWNLFESNFGPSIVKTRVFTGIHDA